MQRSECPCCDREDEAGSRHARGPRRRRCSSPRAAESPAVPRGQRPDDADPQQPGRWLRPDRTHGHRGDGERPTSAGGSFEVTNVIGAGGSVAMARLMNAEGDERTMMTAGLGVVGSLYSFAAPYKLHDATPLAQVIEDQEGVLVPADSPFETIDDLVAAWKDDPDSIVVGGGSSPGGPDHLFPMQLATAVGIDARELRYVAVRRRRPADQRPARQQDRRRLLRRRRVRGAAVRGRAAPARRVRRGPARGRGHQRRPPP